MKGLRVLYWTELFGPGPGGTEVLSGHLLSALRERGHELVVLASHADARPDEEAEHRRIPVFRFPFVTTLAAGDAGAVLVLRRQVAALKRAFAPDLVHLHTVGPSALFHLRTAAAHPAPCLVTPHAPLTSQETGEGTLLGDVFRAATWVTTVSASALDTARRLAPGIVGRSSFVHNGLPPPDLAPAPLPFDPPVLLCLGRLVPDKGFDVAIEAFARLAGRFPRARLVVAGQGPARAELEERARERGLAGRVAFAGLVPAVAPVMNAATLVVMPSRWEETFGLVALEAAQMGRPVVATRVGGLPEVVRHGETGLVVERDDPGALAEAIALLLDHPERARAMGGAARARARETFSLERCADAYDGLYRRLAAVPVSA